MTAETLDVVVISLAIPLEILGSNESRLPLPVESKTAIVSQANVVISEFEQIASMAVALPAEMRTLLAEGKAASSTLKIEVSSAFIRPEIIHQCYDALTQVVQKGKGPFIIGAAGTLGHAVGHKISLLADHLFTNDLPKLIALIEHWFY